MRACGDAASVVTSHHSPYAAQGWRQAYPPRARPVDVGGSNSKLVGERVIPRTRHQRKMRSSKETHSIASGTSIGGPDAVIIRAGLIVIGSYIRPFA